MKASISRRKFVKESLQVCAGLTAASLLPFRLGKILSARADVPNDHYLLVLTVDGGWDVTLSLDPLLRPAGFPEGEFFQEYSEADLLDAGGLRFGRAAHALAPFADRIAIINGIGTDRDAGHDGNRFFMMSGGARQYWVRHLAERSPHPMLGILEQNAGFILGPNSVPIFSPSSLNRLILNDSDSELWRMMGSGARSGSSPWARSAESFLVLQEAMRQARASLQQLQLTSSSPLEVANVDNWVAVLSHAFLNGLVSYASVGIGTGLGSLDTHSQHEGEHLRIQTQVWERVAQVLRRLSEIPAPRGSVLDHTTVAVVSEFARTPALDGSRGKDHNPLTNSVLLAGRGVRGGVTVGASRLIPAALSPMQLPLHVGSPFDFAAGRPVPEGPSRLVEPLRAENLMQTMSAIFGFGPAEGVSSRFAVIPGVVVAG